MRYKVQQSLAGAFLAWIASGWHPPAEDKQPLAGSVCVSPCQYCDRRDAEWHCHRHCQGPVTFAPVVWRAMTERDASEGDTQGGGEEVRINKESKQRGGGARERDSESAYVCSFFDFMFFFF